MKGKERTGEFKEKEVAFVMPARENEELHFSVVELNDKLRADIRYFAEWGEVEGLRATQRGITIDPAKYGEFQKGVMKLSEKLPRK